MTSQVNIPPHRPSDPFTGREFVVWSTSSGFTVGSPICVLEYRDGLARIRQSRSPSRRDEITEATWVPLTQFAFLVPVEDATV